MFYVPVVRYFNFYFFRIEVYRTFAYLAAIIGIIFAIYRAKKRKLNIKHTWLMLFFMIIGLVIGARAFYYFGPYTWSRDWTLLTRFLRFLRFFASGTVSFGGFVGAVVGLYVYCRITKLNFWKYADNFAPAMILGLAVGRIGCFLANDSCRGVATNVPWAVVRHTSEKIVSEPIHPAPIYASIGAIVIFFILLRIEKKKLFEGHIFYLY